MSEVALSVSPLPFSQSELNSPRLPQETDLEENLFFWSPHISPWTSLRFLLSEGLEPGRKERTEALRALARSREEARAGAARRGLRK